jgi:hypothetical protein
VSIATSHTEKRAERRPNIAKWVASILLLSLALGLMLGAAPSSQKPAAHAADEHEVKAAILYRVAKFIDWPATAFDASDAPFVICIAGSEATVHAFDSLVGKQLNGHDISVRRVTGDMLDLRLCHTAYFPADGNADVDYALEKLKGLPVLTVGEVENFALRGGILALLTRDQRVKFTLNLPVSKQAGLAVSSQLLQLATVVGHAP